MDDDEPISFERMPCAKPQPRLPRSAYVQTFALTVTDNSGSDTKVFHFYRGVLERSSSYFSDKLANQWKGGTGFMELADLKCIYSSLSSMEIFESFFFWLNTGQFDFSTGTEDGFLVSLVMAYEFSDKYDIQGFGNALIEAFYLRLVSRGEISPGTMANIYYYTRRGSKLRRVLAEWVFEHDDMAITEDVRDAFHKDLLWDIIALSHARGQGVGYTNRLPESERLDHIRYNMESFCEMYHLHTWDPLATKAKSGNASSCSSGLQT